MKRLAVGGVFIACGVAPFWHTGAAIPSSGVRDLLAVTAMLCRLIPMPMTPAGIAAVLLVLVVLGCCVALALAWRTQRAVGALTINPVRPPERLVTLARRVGLRADLAVADCSGLVAFTHGLVSPRVVVSQELCASLDDAELEAVLRHEGAHAQRRDPLRVLVARTLNTLLVFIPFTRSAIEAYLCRLELSADRIAVTAMADVLPLASALQRVMLQPRRDFAGAAVSGLSATDVRIDHLLGLDTSPALIAPPPNRIHLALFWLIALTTLCAFVASTASAVHTGLCLVC